MPALNKRKSQFPLCSAAASCYCFLHSALSQNQAHTKKPSSDGSRFSFSPFSQRETPRKPKENASLPPVSSNMHIEGRWEKEEGGGGPHHDTSYEGCSWSPVPHVKPEGRGVFHGIGSGAGKTGGAVRIEEECSAWDACVSQSQVFQALDRLFAPLMSTLGLNSKAAEVVSILFMHYDSFQGYLTRVCLSTGRMSWAGVHCNSMVLCFSSHLASFISNIDDRWWKIKSSDRNFTG